MITNKILDSKVKLSLLFKKLLKHIWSDYLKIPIFVPFTLRESPLCLEIWLLPEELEAKDSEQRIELIEYSAKEGLLMRAMKNIQLKVGTSIFILGNFFDLFLL